MRIIAILFLYTLSAYSDIVFVANKNSGITKITLSEIKLVYSGRGREVNGKLIKPIMLKKGAVHDEFCENYMGKSSISLSKIWKKLVFTGKASMILTFNSDEEALSAVKNSMQHIAYIDASKATDDCIFLEVVR